MIVGRGSLASKLKDRHGAIFFASGVSDSCGKYDVTLDYNCSRERKLLNSFIGTRMCLFYFSSIAIAFKSSSYFEHKERMENRIIRDFPNHNIIRIGNLENDTNPTTFLNVLKSKIEKGEPYEIRDEWKYMLTDEDLVSITQSLPLTGGRIINIFSYMAKVKDLL